MTLAILLWLKAVEPLQNCYFLALQAFCLKHYKIFRQNQIEPTRCGYKTLENLKMLIRVGITFGGYVWNLMRMQTVFTHNSSLKWIYLIQYPHALHQLHIGSFFGDVFHQLDHLTEFRSTKIIYTIIFLNILHLHHFYLSVQILHSVIQKICPIIHIHLLFPYKEMMKTWK